HHLGIGHHKIEKLAVGGEAASRTENQRSQKNTSGLKAPHKISFHPNVKRDCGTRVLLTVSGQLFLSILKSSNEAVVRPRVQTPVFPGPVSPASLASKSWRLPKNPRILSPRKLTRVTYHCPTLMSWLSHFSVRRSLVIGTGSNRPFRTRSSAIFF